jgi:hypothetical protein
MTRSADGFGGPAREQRLDAVLRAWRLGRDAGTDIAGLRRRVGVAIRDANLRQAPVAAAGSRQQSWFDRGIWCAGGLAAALAAVAVLQPLGGSRANWPESVCFNPGQVADKATLFAGLKQTFGNQMAWLAEHDRRVDVGLVTDDASAGDGAAFALRVVLLSRQDGATVWQQVWRSDVVGRYEQVIDVPAGHSGSGRLQLWLHALADGGVAVEGALALTEANTPARLSFNGVQRAGEPRRVTGGRGAGQEWQLIQTVVPLPQPAISEKVG